MSTEVHLWRLLLDRDPAEVMALAELLSAEEKARATRFRQPGHSGRFITCRAALRQILACQAGRPPQTLAFASGPAGKPELTDKDATGLEFNVTHSEHVAIIGLTWGRPIGVDVERVRPDFATLEIARRFFSPREWLELEALPAPLRPDAFFRCWTRKEAFIKAIGAGLSFPLDAFDVSLDPGEPAELRAIRGDAAAAGRWTMRELATEPGFAAALVVEGPIAHIIDRGTFI